MTVFDEKDICVFSDEGSLVTDSNVEGREVITGDDSDSDIVIVSEADLDDVGGKEFSCGDTDLDIVLSLAVDEKRDVIGPFVGFVSFEEDILIAVSKVGNIDVVC